MNQQEITRSLSDKSSDSQQFQSPFSRLAGIAQRQKQFLKTKDEKNLKGDELKSLGQELFKNQDEIHSSSSSSSAITTKSNKQDHNLTRMFTKQFSLNYTEHQAEVSGSRKDKGRGDTGQNFKVNLFGNLRIDQANENQIQQLDNDKRNNEFSQLAYDDYIEDLFQSNSYLSQMQAGLEYGYHKQETIQNQIDNMEVILNKQDVSQDETKSQQHQAQQKTTMDLKIVEQKKFPNDQSKLRNHRKYKKDQQKKMNYKEDEQDEKSAIESNRLKLQLIDRLNHSVVKHNRLDTIEELSMNTFKSQQSEQDGLIEAEEKKSHNAPVYGDLIFQNERRNEVTFKRRNNTIQEEEIQDNLEGKTYQTEIKQQYNGQLISQLKTRIISSSSLNQDSVRQQPYKIDMDSEDGGDTSCFSDSGESNTFMVDIATTTIIGTLGILLCRQIPELKKKSWLGMVPGLLYGTINLILK